MVRKKSTAFRIYFFRYVDAYANRKLWTISFSDSRDLKLVITPKSQFWKFYTKILISQPQKLNRNFEIEFLFSGKRSHKFFFSFFELKIYLRKYSSYFKSQLHTSYLFKLKYFKLTHKKEIAVKHTSSKVWSTSKI